MPVVSRAPEGRMMAWRGSALAAVLSMAPLSLAAQTNTEREPGLRDATPRWHALTGVRLVVAPGRAVDEATLVLKDGIVVAAGRGVAVPAGARVWPLPGRTVHAGFIDLASSLGVPRALRAAPMPRPTEGPGSELPPPDAKPPEAEPLAGRSLATRNRYVRAEQDVTTQLEWKPDDMRRPRELGFTTVLAAPQAGVFRGQSALVATGEAPDAKALVVAGRVAQHMAFEFERGDKPVYPVSLMGSIALARQVLHDARWYRSATAGPGADSERVAPNVTLAALAPVLDRRQPVIHQLADELDVARAARLQAEFGHRLVLQGTGHEYRVARQLKATALPVIVPLAFPDAPDVSHPDTAIDVPLHALAHWEQAPSNLAHLQRAGVPFAVTASGLKKPEREFWPRLRRAVRRGLDPDHALAALTTQPASFIGQSDRLGTLEPGRIANVVVARGDLFRDDDAEVELVFVDGRPLPNDGFLRPDARGRWKVDRTGEELEITGKRAAPKLQGSGTACALHRELRTWVLRLPCGEGAGPGAATIVVEVRDDRLVGTVQASGEPMREWSASRVGPPPPASPPEAEPAVTAPDTYPAGAYGVQRAARAGEVLVRHATVWTQGAAGTLAADLLVRDGRIVAVGAALRAGRDAHVIDATGKHVTPGLIDAHSHIAMNFGTNEWATENSAEVRVSDILDPTDISIYRIAAGGVTTALVLHGSANTIGGQSQAIKLRWGSDADGLVFEGAAPTIKFALGENPKFSNWRPMARYPASRMGVEQLLRDAFARARDYRRERSQAQARGAPEPRRDLRLDALVEVLEGRRLVHVHSYRADEILMFARLARELDFPVAAFQHVLEGYKVTDAIASIGAGASSFSDWWGFKMEVQDAVPANPALLARAGVVTSVHSDNAELARRMNAEAAKAIKYGGLRAQEALALVTSQPARQLRVERRVGSIEPGKDADFVIWNGPPLSSLSRVEQTWIDGQLVFDLEADARLRAAADQERARLVALASKARAAAGKDAAGDDGKDDGADAPAPRGAFEGALRWQDVWSGALRLRAPYAGLGAWHECTEHGP